MVCPCHGTCRRFLPPADFDLDIAAPQAGAGGQEEAQAAGAQAEGAEARDAQAGGEDALEVEVMRAEAPGSETRAQMLSPDLALRPAFGAEEGPGVSGFPEWAEETPGGAEGETGSKRKAPASAGPSSAGLPSVSPASAGGERPGLSVSAMSL